MKKTMNDYIIETRDVGICNLENRKALTAELVSLYCDGSYQDITIIASGSSGNGAECARLFMEEVLGCQVKVVPPFTFENYENDIRENTLVFVISQSGYSTNAMAALEKLKEIGRPAIGITGDMNSDFKKCCDLLIDYGVGIETVGYVTKGVVTLCEFLMLFALEAALKHQKIDDSKYQTYAAEMRRAFDCRKEMYQAVCTFYENNQKALLSMQHVYICSGGPGLGVAKEAALKIGETIQIPAVAYEIEEYIHGPNLQLTPNYTVFLIDNHDKTSPRTLQIFDATKAVTDRAFLISNRRKGDHVIGIEQETLPVLSPLYVLVAFQYLSFKITEELDRWEKHPLFSRFEEIADGKSENYSSSPLASQEK